MINYIDNVHFQNLPVYGLIIHPTTGFPNTPTGGQVVWDLSSERYFYYKPSASGWYMLGSGSTPLYFHAISGGQNNNPLIMSSGGSIRYTGGGIVDANRYKGNAVIAVVDGGTNTSEFQSQGILHASSAGDSIESSPYLAAQAIPNNFAINIGDTAPLFRGAITIGDNAMRPFMSLYGAELVDPVQDNCMEYDGTLLYLTAGNGVRNPILTSGSLLSNLSGTLPINRGGTSNEAFASGSVVLSNGVQLFGAKPSGTNNGGLLQVHGTDTNTGSGYNWLYGNESFPAEVPFWNGSRWTPINSINYFVYNSPDGTNYNWITPTSGNHGLFINLGSANQSYIGFAIKSPTGANYVSVNGSGQLVLHQGHFRLNDATGNLVDFRNASVNQYLGFDGSKWYPTGVSAVGGATIHNALLGLTNDDHLQYLLVNPTGTNRNVISGSIAAITPLTVMGISGQTAPLFRAYSATHNERFCEINSSGNLNVGAITGGFSRLSIGSGNASIGALYLEPSQTFPASIHLHNIANYQGWLYYKSPYSNLSVPNQISLAGSLNTEQTFLDAARNFEVLGIHNENDGTNHQIRYVGTSNLASFIPEVSGAIVVGPPDVADWGTTKAAFANGVAGSIQLRVINSGDLPANIMYTGIATLSNLADVQVTSPATNHILQHNGTRFVNTLLSSGVINTGVLGNAIIKTPWPGFGNIIQPTHANTEGLRIVGQTSQTADLFSAQLINNPGIRVDSNGFLLVGNITALARLAVSGSARMTTNVEVGNSVYFFNRDLLMGWNTVVSDSGNAYLFAGGFGTDLRQIQAGSLILRNNTINGARTFLARQGYGCFASGIYLGSGYIDHANLSGMLYVQGVRDVPQLTVVCATGQFVDPLSLRSPSGILVNMTNSGSMKIYHTGLAWTQKIGHSFGTGVFVNGVASIRSTIVTPSSCFNICIRPGGPLTNLGYTWVGSITPGSGFVAYCSDSSNNSLFNWDIKEPF